MPPALGSDSRRTARRLVHERVPPIGARWRWYDIVYRLAQWPLAGRRRRYVRWRLRQLLHHVANFMYAFNDYERSKVESVDDPLYGFVVPAGERVRQEAIWVVELFPPSQYRSLQVALNRQRWGSADPWRHLDGTNEQRVTEARRRNRDGWSRLGSVARPDAGMQALGATPQTLPAEFRTVELTAAHVGTSLTAVVAAFYLTEGGATSLDRVWRSDHEPLLQWDRWRRPAVEGRNFAAIINTQTERLRLHDLARTWLTQRAPGFFASTDSRQPVIDYTLFDRYDPTGVTGDAGDHRHGEDPERRAMREPLRALGMSGNPFYDITSPQLPGLVLMAGEHLRRPQRRLRNSWGVVGAIDTVRAATDDVGYGPRPYSSSTLARICDDFVRAFLLRVAVERYTEQVRETLTAARDTARTTHRTYGPRALGTLRNELLSSSLDLAPMARDTASLWDPVRPLWDQPTVTATANHASRRHPVPPEPIDVIAEMGRRRERAFEELLAEDAAYRGVLATVSALGSSATSTRLARRALTVSAMSLLVTISTLVLVNGDQAWRHLTDLLSRVV